MEARLTAEALTTVRGGRRPFVLSRSTFASHGAHAAHWTGDNAATWRDLAASTVTVMNFGLFGIPFVGSDICGFIDNTTEELCARWIEVGAFHPFSRNHNIENAKPQELYRWDSVTTASKNALGLRYSLLPFFYTLLADAQASGALVTRALWANYPEDPATHDVDSQFMLGDAVLVSPVVTEGATSVDAYFPSGIWYSLFGVLNEYDSDEAEELGVTGLADTQPRRIVGGEITTLETPLTASNAHVRAGVILPLHSFGAMTTTEALAQPNRLLVVLDGSASAVAQGHAFYDDGGDEATDGTTGSTVVACDAAAAKGISCVVQEDTYSGAADRELGTVVVVGAPSAPNAVYLSVTGKAPTSPAFTWDSDRMRITVDLSGQGVALNTAFDLTWTL